MGKLNLSISIDADPETVFDVVADVGNSPERIEWSESVELLTDGAVGVGTGWRETRVMNNKKSFEAWEATAVERPKYIACSELK